MTGGGFSWHFSAPSYNSAQTSAFANSLDSSYQGYFNPSGRGYPDISLISRNYDTVIQGQGYRLDGTSASSPAWAGLVTILNDDRVAKGQPTLGFLNPLLYSQGAAALNDITKGSNPGCGTEGFPAVTGWDAVRRECPAAFCLNRR